MRLYEILLLGVIFTMYFSIAVADGTRLVFTLLVKLYEKETSCITAKTYKLILCPKKIIIRTHNRVNHAIQTF